MPITYVVGDATHPIGDLKENKIIAHVCNDVGGWGRGFVLAISSRWKEPEQSYRAWNARTLGDFQVVKVDEKLYVANMIAQRDIKTVNGIPPIRYHALLACLQGLSISARSLYASVHMPRIGCGLAGGTWDQVEPLIRQAMQHTEVYVYDLTPTK
jgi:O-acetyl-ADP-ribose deacetylase (regulator of RNase III)